MKEFVYLNLKGHDDDTDIEGSKYDIDYFLRITKKKEGVHHKKEILYFELRAKDASGKDKEEDLTGNFEIPLDRINEFIDKIRAEAKLEKR